LIYLPSFLKKKHRLHCGRPTKTCNFYLLSFALHTAFYIAAGGINSSIGVSCDPERSSLQIRLRQFLELQIQHRRYIKFPRYKLGRQKSESCIAYLSCWLLAVYRSLLKDLQVCYKRLLMTDESVVRTVTVADNRRMTT